MTVPSSAPALADRYWIVALARAVLALIATAIITFSADHSAPLGLVVFGAYALASGLVGIVGAFTIRDRVLRGVSIAQGAFGVIAGVFALVLHDSGLGVLLFTVSVWAALTGFAEIYCSLRVRGRAAISRDWLVVGSLTVILAIIYMLIPADSVLAVGLFGAYAAIIGVYLGIGAFTLKWAAATHETAGNKA